MSPNNARARAAPVGVTVVSVSGMSGNRARRACTSEAAACTSPTDTACTQIDGAAVSGPNPKRWVSPSR